MMPLQQWWDCRWYIHLLAELLGAGSISSHLHFPAVYCRWHLDSKSLLFCSWKTDAISYFCFDLKTGLLVCAGVVISSPWRTTYFLRDSSSGHRMSLDQVSLKTSLWGILPGATFFMRHQQAGWWLIGALQKNKLSCPGCSSSASRSWGGHSLDCFWGSASGKRGC